MNAILGIYTDLDEFTDLQCDYAETLEKCERLEKELSKSRTMSKSFEALQKHAINLELDYTQYIEKSRLESSTSQDYGIAIMSLKKLIEKMKGKSVETRVIPTTSVSRPSPKSNQLEDRVMSNNNQGKEQKVEDHRRNFMFSNNKTSVTATRQPMAVPISTRKPKQNVNQSVATSSKKTVATDSTVKKSRNITRKLYEQVSKTCSWWYPKYTPPGYNWKPKSQKGNVNPNISMPLGNASRTANILEHKTPRCSTVSNTPLSSNSFAARRDHSIHRRLWVLKAHDRKSQTSN
ncbi:hypothetical protein Tco_1314374 [Tanacetum coccineum]